MRGCETADELKVAAIWSSVGYPMSETLEDRKMTALVSTVPVSLATTHDATRSVRVLKFGGTSLDGPQRIRRAAGIIEQAARQSRLAVVVSAMAGITDSLAVAVEQAQGGEVQQAACDHLLARHLECSRDLLDDAARAPYDLQLCTAVEQLARWLDGVRLLGECPPFARHRILATGERLVAPLVAAALRRNGLQATVLDGEQLIAAGAAGHEHVDCAETRLRVAQNLAPRLAAEIPVITGFTASDNAGRTTTLGRGASDYSATLIAAAVDADQVEIWTDVDGVLSADPKIVPQALPLPQLTYEEATHLAGFGAGILHPQTLAPLAGHRIPISIRNSLRPEHPGTRIGSGEWPTARAVTMIPEVVRFLLRVGGPQHLGCLSLLRQPPLLLSWESTSRSLSLVVRPADAERVEEAIVATAEKPSGLTVVDRQKLALIANLGPAEDFAAALPALAARGIRVESLVPPEASAGSAVLLVDRRVARPVVRWLHRELVQADPACQGAVFACGGSAQAARLRDATAG